MKEMRRLVGQMKADTSTNLNYDPREDEVILKEIRERVQSIATSTPYLDQQKELEKQIKALAAQGMTPEMIEAHLRGEAVQPELATPEEVAMDAAPESIPEIAQEAVQEPAVEAPTDASSGA